MTRRTDMTADLQRLERALLTFGADPSRWPQEERVALSALIEADGEAQRLVREARALDQTLSASAPAPDAAVQRAKERLFARLEDEPSAPFAQPATVVPFQRPVTEARTGAKQPPRWREAALLAASLMLGLFVGMQGLLHDSGVRIPGLTGDVTAEAQDSDDVSEMALGSDVADEAEEELL